MIESPVREATIDVPTIPGKYLSITSYRRDGTPVATPVWFVQEHDRILVETDGGSCKVKRINRDPRVSVAPCSAMGRIQGQAVVGRAEVLPEAERPRVERLIARKYRVDMLFIKPIRAIQRAMHRGRPERPVILSIRLAVGGTAGAGGDM
jgi:PPOX class probable F420-dependent enzyme